MYNTTDQVLVFVTETITYPPDLNLEYGFEKITIEWEILNQNFTSYTLHLNQTLLQKITQNVNGKISVDLFNLDIGVYVYTLLLNHSSGDVIQDEVIITVYEAIEISETIESSDLNETSSTPPPSTPPFDIEDAPLIVAILLFVGGLVAGMISQRRRVVLLVKNDDLNP